MAKSMVPNSAPHFSMTASRLPGCGNVKLFEELGAERFSQWLGVFGGLVVLVGNRDIGTEGAHGLGNGESDGLVVGDAGNQALLASQRQERVGVQLWGLFDYCSHAVLPFRSWSEIMLRRTILCTHPPLGGGLGWCGAPCDDCCTIPFHLDEIYHRKCVV
jgi:hypothetical protein